MTIILITRSKFSLGIPFVILKFSIANEDGIKKHFFNDAEICEISSVISEISEKLDSW